MNDADPALPTTTQLDILVQPKRASTRYRSQLRTVVGAVLLVILQTVSSRAVSSCW